jgi:hypothetical protein
MASSQRYFRGVCPADSARRVMTSQSAQNLHRSFPGAPFAELVSGQRLEFVRYTPVISPTRLIKDRRWDPKIENHFPTVRMKPLVFKEILFRFKGVIHRDLLNNYLCKAHLLSTNSLSIKINCNRISEQIYSNW